ncbi:MAG: site-2 protease family protein, partial [Tepidisphaeraceae bacterium]
GSQCSGSERNYQLATTNYHPRMLAVRPTFSESWYRVANLRAKLRASAQISRQFYRGERWYVVRDPAGNQFHRLSDPAYRFVALLDGTRTVEQAWDLAGGQLADDAPTQPEVIQILSQLYAANLIETNVTPDAGVLLRRHQNLMKRKFQSRLMSALFPRIPLWDPDRFLKRWMPLMRIMLSKFGAVLWLVLVIGALATILPRWDELKLAAQNAIAPRNWLYLWATFVIIKLIHELGHAFACRRFGGECHEMGIMFLVFIPTPYVDASSAWAFPNRWQRIFVGAAGMVFELFVAALAAFVWVTTKPGIPLWGVPVNELAYNTMLIASVSTLLFNANPLLRYDGYYMLSDFLEIPNLQQKSKEYTLGLIKRHVFRVKQFQPLPPAGQRVLLFVYGILSSIYRVFVGVMIILLVSTQVPVLGQLMAIGGVITWLVVPVVGIFKYLSLSPELHRKRGPATAYTVGFAAAVIGFLGLVPWWVHVDSEGYVEPLQRRVLHSPQGGFVTEVVARDGQELKKDDVILVCRDPELDAQLAQTRARVKSLEAQLNKSRVLDQAQRQIDEIQLAAVKEQLDEALRKHGELTLRAPIAGRLIAPDINTLPGQYLDRGKEVCTVATTDRLIVKAALEQRDAQLVSDEPGAPVEVRLIGAVGDEPLQGASVELLKAAQNKVAHSALTQQGGGVLQADPRDPSGQTVTVPPFELRVSLNNPGERYLPGQRAYVRVELEKQPLAKQWWRKLLQLLQTAQQQKSELT